jgi:hypothetical protein
VGGTEAEQGGTEAEVGGTEVGETVAGTTEAEVGGTEGTSCSPGLPPIALQAAAPPSETASSWLEAAENTLPPFFPPKTDHIGPRIAQAVAVFVKVLVASLWVCQAL